MIDRIKRALVIAIVRRQLVAGQRVTGAPSAWNLAGRGSDSYARLLALAARCLEGDVPACIPCRVRPDRVDGGASPKTSVIRRRPLLKSTGKAYLDCS